jgi:hypothetical protein
MVPTVSYEVWVSLIIAGGDLGDPVSAEVGTLVYNEPGEDLVVQTMSCFCHVGAFVLWQHGRLLYSGVAATTIFNISGTFHVVTVFQSC